MLDYQGVVVAMTVLPGQAEIALFIHKPLGDNIGLCQYTLGSHIYTPGSTNEPRTAPSSVC